MLLLSGSKHFYFRARENVSLEDSDAPMSMSCPSAHMQTRVIFKLFSSHSKNHDKIQPSKIPTWVKRRKSLWYLIIWSSLVSDFFFNFP